MLTVPVAYPQLSAVLQDLHHHEVELLEGQDLAATLFHLYSKLILVEHLPQVDSGK